MVWKEQRDSQSSKGSDSEGSCVPFVLSSPESRLPMRGGICLSTLKDQNTNSARRIWCWCGTKWMPSLSRQTNPCTNQDRQVRSSIMGNKSKKPFSTWHREGLVWNSLGNPLSLSLSLSSQIPDCLYGYKSAPSEWVGESFTCGYWWVHEDTMLLKYSHF